MLSAYDANTKKWAKIIGTILAAIVLVLGGVAGNNAGLMPGEPSTNTTELRIRALEVSDAAQSEAIKGMDGKLEDIKEDTKYTRERIDRMFEAK